MDNSEFKEVLSFQHDGKVDLLPPFDHVKLDSARIVIWQMISYSGCHGVFFSNYANYDMAAGLDNVWDLFETAIQMDSRERRTAMFRLAGELAACQNLLDWTMRSMPSASCTCWGRRSRRI